MHEFINIWGKSAMQMDLPVNFDTSLGIVNKFIYLLKIVRLFFQSVNPHSGWFIIPVSDVLPKDYRVVACLLILVGPSSDHRDAGIAGAKARNSAVGGEDVGGDIL
jgi:hypothetical protein